MIVSLIDRIKMLLDDPENVVVLSSYDWSGAFDRLDPTKIALKMINLGIRSSVVKVIIDFLRDRVMEVKMNGQTSPPFNLVGGGPQGSLIGQLLYIITSDDAAEEVPEDDKHKYVNDLTVLEALKTEGKLMEYDVREHVPSDVATGQPFLPPNKTETQSYNNSIAVWTNENLMKLNKEKSNYMVFHKGKETFATRFTLDEVTLERKKKIIHLGVWLDESLKWDTHISEICRKAYPRIKMLSKLRFVGSKMEDLVELYCLHIRSLTEYCSTAFHSSLTQKLSNKLEAIQKTCLRVILGDMYIEYSSALEMCGLTTLFLRREKRSLDFALKCINHPVNSLMFPTNPSLDTHEIRNREKFKVNKCRSELYKKSAIPVLQRRLNAYMEKLEELRRRRSIGAGGQRARGAGERQAKGGGRRGPG